MERSSNIGARTGWRHREAVLLEAIGRDQLPPSHKLQLLAKRIYEETRLGRAARWESLPESSASYRTAMTMARAALSGSAMAPSTD